MEGCDGERCGGGVQENECVCILKAVFLCKKKNSSLTGKRIGRANDERMQMQFSDGN